jgi:hypothetical protein
VNSPKHPIRKLNWFWSNSTNTQIESRVWMLDSKFETGNTRWYYWLLWVAKRNCWIFSVGKQIRGRFEAIRTFVISVRRVQCRYTWISVCMIYEVQDEKKGYHIRQEFLIPRIESNKNDSAIFVNSSFDQWSQLFIFTITCRHPVGSVDRNWCLHQQAHMNQVKKFVSNWQVVLDLKFQASVRSLGYYSKSVQKQRVALWASPDWK